LSPRVTLLMIRKTHLITICLFLICFSFNISSAKIIRTVYATVIKVSDGDSITAETKEGTKLKIRLYGIDAPEIEIRNKVNGEIVKHGQPFGRESRKHLASQVLNKNVRLEILAIDRYRREVAIVWLGDLNVNLEMIKVGMAEAYTEYLKDEPYRTQFLQAEKQAKNSKIGIWSLGSNYERPSDFKKRMKNKK